MKEEDKELYRASIKSMDTEEFLDMWFYRPLGFRCALFFRNRGIHPNIITIISISAITSSSNSPITICTLSASFTSDNFMKQFF